jgi:hypothetical protein
MEDPVIIKLERRIGFGELRMFMFANKWTIELGTVTVCGGLTTADQRSVIVDIDDLHALVAWAESEALAARDRGALEGGSDG